MTGKQNLSGFDDGRDGMIWRIIPSYRVNRHCVVTMLGGEGRQLNLSEIISVGQFHVTYHIGENPNFGVRFRFGFRHDNNRHDSSVAACFVEITKVESVVFNLPLRLQSMRFVLSFEFKTEDHVRSQQHCIKPLLPPGNWIL